MASATLKQFARSADPGEIANGIEHGGGANHSQGERTGLYFGFVLSWLRPLENHLVTNGAAALEAAAPAVQRLLGYTNTGFDVIP